MANGVTCLPTLQAFGLDDAEPGARNSKRMIKALMDNLFASPTESEKAKTVEQCKLHLMELCAWMGLGGNECVAIDAYVEKYFAAPNAVPRSKLSAVKRCHIFHFALYVMMSMMRDVFIGKNLWNHVTRKPFDTFYDGVLDFCALLQFNLVLSAVEFNCARARLEAVYAAEVGADASPPPCDAECLETRRDSLDSETRRMSNASSAASHVSAASDSVSSPSSLQCKAVAGLTFGDTAPARLKRAAV